MSTLLPPKPTGLFGMFSVSPADRRGKFLAPTPTDAQAITALNTGRAQTMREAFAPPVRVMATEKYGPGLSRSHHRRGNPPMGGV